MRRSSLVWALTAMHFVSRAGGVARSFLVLYLTQERQLSPMTAVALVALGSADTCRRSVRRPWVSG